MMYLKSISIILCGIILLVLTLSHSYANDPHNPVFVCGLAGGVKGGSHEKWNTHRGEVTFSIVKKQKDHNQMHWSTALVPVQISSSTVTFVWMGAMGIGPSHQSGFTISVNGQDAVDFDVALEPTNFSGRVVSSRLIFTIKYAPPVKDYKVFPEYAVGYFYLTVPISWIKPGQPAEIQVTAKIMESPSWFGLTASDEIPLSLPDQICKKYLEIKQTERFQPPPQRQEGSIEWYSNQYDDNSILTPIGPPSDPADIGVSTSGQIMYNFDRVIPGTAYISNALVFAIVEDDRAIPFGWEPTCRQKLVDDVLPCVLTEWNISGWNLQQMSFARALRGDSYTTGLESTLGWAEFHITNISSNTREFAILATRIGNIGKIQRDLTFHDGVVFESESARFAAFPPLGFNVEFLPIFPRHFQYDSNCPIDLLRSGGLYNALEVRGLIPPGETRKIAFNCVFDSPGMDHVKSDPPRVEASELITRSVEKDRKDTLLEWRNIRNNITNISTPDKVLNRIIQKGMLDGYNLTKRWNGNWICFDSVCYRRQWDDTSAKWIYALDLMGDHNTSRQLLETIFLRQGQRKPAGTRTHQGCFSDITNTDHDGSLSSWASCNGWALWSMVQHARLSNDKNWWDCHNKQVLEGVEWIRRERGFSKETPGNPCAGLINGKFVCDMPDEWGPGGVGYFTYTDAISYMGLHETALLMKEWGYSESEELLNEAEEYRQDIIAAIDRLTDKSSDPWFIPWTLHAPRFENSFFNGVCGPINLAYARVLPCADLRIDHVICWNIEHTHQGSLEKSATNNMFYSQDLAITLLELGRVEEFLRMFYTILAADVSPRTLTTFEWWNNTQPHLHSISSMIRMARTMLIQERDDTLYLLQGTPRRWYEQGERIDIVNAPTHYGVVSLETVSNIQENKILFFLSPPVRINTSPIYIKLRPPGDKRITGVTIDGQEHKEFNKDCIILKNIKNNIRIIATLE